jgi:hypothetical protein
METSYRNVHLLVIGVLFTTLAGFLFTYFMLFPKFEGISITKHLHGLSLFAWYAMLIAQPILIKKGKLQAHRSLGKLSYVLMPLIVLGILAVGAGGYHAALAKSAPAAEAIGGLSLSLPGAIMLAIVYALAIWHRKNPVLHMRYMICTLIPMLGPGLGRAVIIFGRLPFPIGVAVADYAAMALCAALIIYDWRKGKNFTPYVVALVLTILVHLAFINNMGAVWQAFGGAYARIFL